MSDLDQVIEFHRKFDIPIGGPGYLITEDRALLRARLMMEELAELIEAMQMKDYPAVAKELADVLYVVHGTAIEYGIPLDDVFTEVHRSNMTKTGGPDTGGKITKGEYYEPPEIENIL